MYNTGKPINHFYDIAQTLNACDTLHVALNDESFPFVMPLMFGFEIVEEEVVLYFYIHKEAHAHELIKKDPHAALETEILYNYFDVPREYVSCAYGQITGHGVIEAVKESDYDYGMDLILTHCGYEGFLYNPALYDEIIMYKVKVEDLEGRINIHKPQ